MTNEFLSKLDEVLSYLLKNRSLTNDGCLTEKQVLDNCFGGIYSFDFKDVITQLKKDEYIWEHDDKGTRHFQIYPAGRFLIENNGYINLSQKRHREKSLQILAIWVTAIGTGLAGAYALWEMSKAFLNYCFCRC